MKIFKLFSFFFLLLLMAFQPSSAYSADLRTWVQNAAAEIMTFHFGNFKNRLHENSQYFTPEGYNEFARAIERSGMARTVAQNKQMVESEVLCLPVVNRETTSDAPSWQLSFPMKTTYVEGAKAKTDYLRVEVIVESQSSEKNPYGIAQWIARPIEESEAKLCSETDYKKARIETLRGEIREREEQIKQLEQDIQ